MEESTIEYQKYLKMVIKRRRLLIVVSLCIMTVVVWGSYFLPKKYSANSTIFIESNVIKELVSGIAINPEMGSRVRIIGYTMLSRELIAETLKALDLDVKTKTPYEFEKMVNDFRSRTMIDLRLDRSVFIVSITDENPQLARDYINALVSKYVEHNLMAKKEESVGASRFLEEQVLRAKEDLDKLEGEMNEHRRQKGVFVTMDQSGMLSDIRDYEKEIQHIRMKKNELAAIINRVEMQLKKEQPMISIFSGRSVKGEQEEINKQIIILENRLKLLLVRFTSNYPEVIRLKSEIEILKKRRKEMALKDNAEEPSEQAAESVEQENLTTVNPTYQQLKEKLFAAESELSRLKANEDFLSRQIKVREKDVISLPVEKKELMALQSDYFAKRKLFDDLKGRLEQSRLSKQMEVADKSTTFRIIDPAVLPQKPVSPNRVMLILLGIVGGIGGGLGCVFLLDLLRSSFKDVQAIKDLGLPVLAVIPRMIDQVQQLREARRDRLIYLAAAGYFLIFICSPLFIELLGLTLIDRVFEKILRG